MSAAMPTPDERPVMSVEEAGRWLGLGRSAAYAAVARGELPVLRFNGRSLRVPTAALRRLVGIDTAGSEDGPDGARLRVVPDSNDHRRDLPPAG